MKSAVSVRGQTVIPRWIREKFHIDFHTSLEWVVVDEEIMVLPLSADPVKDAWGMLKETNISTRALLKAREEEKDLEEKRAKMLEER